jgi:hypothetical protein
MLIVAIAVRFFNQIRIEAACWLFHTAEAMMMVLLRRHLDKQTNSAELRQIRAAAHLIRRFAIFVAFGRTAKPQYRKTLRDRHQ